MPNVSNLSNILRFYRKVNNNVCNNQIKSQQNAILAYFPPLILSCDSRIALYCDFLGFEERSMGLHFIRFFCNEISLNVTFLMGKFGIVGENCVICAA